jgi:hypothetical protein
MSETAASEHFAALLEETGTGRHHRRPDDADPELVAMVGVTHRLARVEGPDVRPQFRDELLARLLQVAEGQRADRSPVPVQAPQPSPVAGPALPPRPRRGADDLMPVPAGTGAGGSEGPVEPRVANTPTQLLRAVRQRLGGRARLAAFVGLAAGALAISGVSLASGDAVPGDTLYPVKGLGEQAQLFFAGSDADRGHLHLDFARTRLVESRQVAPDAVAGVLATMDSEITEGARLLFTAGFSAAEPERIDSVISFVQQHRADLVQLRLDVPAAQDPAVTSLDLLTAVEIRANELRAALVDGCSAASVDRFGPAPDC